MGHPSLQVSVQVRRTRKIQERHCPSLLHPGLSRCAALWRNNTLLCGHGGVWTTAPEPPWGNTTLNKAAAGGRGRCRASCPALPCGSLFPVGQVVAGSQSRAFPSRVLAVAGAVGLSRGSVDSTHHLTLPRQALWV